MKSFELCLVAGLSLSACSSINSNSLNQNSSNQAATQFPIEAAFINIYAKTSNETLYGTVENIPVVVEFETIPKGTVNFNGERVQGTTEIATTKILGEVVDKTVGVNYFTLNPLMFRGFTSEDEYSVATQTASIPKSANVGESSTYLTENVYSDSRRSKLINRYTQTWTLAQANDRTAWLCIENSVNLLLDNDPDGTVSECYRINDKGDILDSKIENIYPTDEGTATISFNRG